MPESTLLVSIVYSQEDIEDRLFAEKLQCDLKHVLRADLLSIEELAAHNEQNFITRLKILRHPLVILSDSTMRDKRFRESVVKKNLSLKYPALANRHHYICRGISLLQ